MPLTLTLNGESVLLEGNSITLDAFLQAQGLRADRIAVERNGAIVPRHEWSATPVCDHDRLEVVHFVGGGSPVSR